MKKVFCSKMNNLYRKHVKMIYLKTKREIVKEQKEKTFVRSQIIILLEIMFDILTVLTNVDGVNKILYKGKEKARE